MTEPRDGVDVTAQSQLEDSRRTTELLLRARDGDLAAWDEILRRYGTLVSTTVRSFRLQEADALDAIQMTWLRLAENVERVQFPERLGGWLATTARCECLHILRRAKRAPEFIDAVDDTAAGPSVGPEQRVIDANTAPTLWTVVEGLPPHRRTLLRALFTDDPRPFAEVAHAAGIPVGGIGPTRARVLRELRRILDERGGGSPEPTSPRERRRPSRSTPASSTPLRREPTEGDRTGSHLLDNLLDKADQALREKLEPKVTDLRIGSTQGTGDAQLDDLLHRADAALRVAIRDHGTTVSGVLSAEANDLDDRVALLPADRLQEKTRAQSDAIAHNVGDTADALLGCVEEFFESGPSELDETPRPTRSGRIQAAGRPPVAAPTTPPPSGDRAPLLSRTAWSAAACVGVGLGTAGALVFAGHSFGAGTIYMLGLGGVLLVCLGLLLGATWTIQPKVRRQAEERRRLNEEWSAVHTARRQRSQCPRCASPLSERDWYFAPTLAENPAENPSDDD